MQQADERIRKAREIYYRRNGVRYRGETEKNKKNHWKGIAFILVFIVGLYAYQYKDTQLSDEIQTKVKNILNTPINFSEIFNLTNKTQTAYIENKEVKTDSTTEEEQTEEQSEQQENEQNSQQDDSTTETESEIYSVIWPFQGTITSGFGERESEDSRVGTNHTGIDIAGNERR